MGVKEYSNMDTESLFSLFPLFAKFKLIVTLNFILIY